MIKREFNILLAAIVFFTRIRVKIPDSCSSMHFNQAVRYLPWLGFMIGAFAGLIAWGSAYIFPPSIAVLLAIVVSILITAAFHEDGLADVFDGFGGGYTRERIMDIMKDSRIGTYGVISLVLVLLFRYALLTVIPFSMVPIALILGNTLSRFQILPVMHFLSYARTDSSSKSKPVIKTISYRDMLFGLIPVALAFWLTGNPSSLLLWTPVIPLTILMAWYFRKKIGGYTGDCLGAIQQICEVVIYMGICVWLKYC